MGFGNDLYNSIFSGPELMSQSATEGNLATAGDVNTQALKGLVAEQMKSADTNNGRREAGKVNADFWQGTRQNLPGQANQTNRANLGAKFGTAQSVMDDQPLLAGAGEQLGKVSGLARGYGAAKGAESQAKRGDATMGFEKEQSRAEIKNLDRQSALNATLGFINSGVSGYSMGKSFMNANPGAVDSIKTKAGDAVADTKSVGGQMLDSWKQGKTAPSIPEMYSRAEARRNNPNMDYSRPSAQNPLAQFDWASAGQPLMLRR